MKLPLDKPGFWATAWFAMLFCQAVATPIHVDEAYYWMFSQRMDWGFFDHPPMVAGMVWVSRQLVSGFLEVRLLTIISSALGLWLIWKTCEPRHQKALFFFWALAFSLPLLHVYGFITTPDAPLLLTTALFLFLYKKVLATNKTIDFLLLGISMSLMLYSKYHGLLVILFTVISNKNLWSNWRFYLSAIIGAACFVPHLYWQYQHEWVSFLFHLGERRYQKEWYHPLEFLGNFLLIFNPLLIGFVWKTIRFRPASAFERALLSVFIGFGLFFFLQSFRDHVQPQWLVMMYWPFLILLVNNFTEKQYSFLTKTLWLTVPLLLVGHIVMAFDILPDSLGIHRKKELTERVKTAAAGRPVMWLSSYQNASIYAYYQNEPNTHSYNMADRRRNQFNLWFLDSLQSGKEIFIAGGRDYSIEQKECDGFWGSKSVFYPFEKIRFDKPDSGKVFDQKQTDSVLIASLTLFNPYQQTIDFQKSGLMVYAYLFFGKKTLDKVILLENSPAWTILAGQNLSVSLSIPVKSIEKADGVGFAIGSKNLPPATMGKVFYLNE